MSIIYDALKKIQTDTKNNNILVPERKPLNTKNHKYRTYFLAAILLAFISAYVFLRPAPNPPSSLAQQKQVTDPQASEEATLTTPALTYTSPSEEMMFEVSSNDEPKTPSLSLNGLFFSENEKYAIINNQIVREGDVLAGATVKRITSSGVELDFEGSSLQLKN